MNCAHWEERIALYMGNDLEPRERAELERHLAECAGCQLFASGMRDALDVLREAHSEEPGPAAYAAVRARVLGELEGRPARRWYFGLAAAAAVMAALLMMVWMRPAKRTVVAHHQPSPHRQVIAPEAPMVSRPAMVPVRRVLRHRKPPAPMVQAAAPETPLVVKMVTDDPGVVIYWITDTRGQ